MTNPLNQEQISTASAYLSSTLANDFSQVESPMQQMTHLLVELACHPSHFDDLGASDSDYTHLKQYASNSCARAEDALKGIADLLETIGCAGDGLETTQVARVSCLLSLVADNLATSRELHEGATRVLAVRKIARLQAENMERAA